MRQRYLRLLMAILLTLSVAAGSGAGLGEELGELDLFDPEIYVGEVEASAAMGIDPTAGEPPLDPAALPEEVLPPEEAPAIQAPIEEAPAVQAPIEEAPAVPAPVEAAPVVPAPVEAAPVVPAAIPASLTLGVKETFALNGAALSGGLPVYYVSSNPKHVSVDENGVVTGRKVGAAVVSCFVGDAPLGDCVVTVLKAPKKVTLPAKSAVISAGESRLFAASLPSRSGGTICYESDNPAVLAVNSEGMAYGVSGGTATLTARAYNGKSASCVVRVLGGPPPTWVALEPGELQLTAKATAQLSACFDPGCDALLQYATSNKKVATVDDAGTVTAKRAGEAVITVTTHNGLIAACPVTVYTAPKKVTLSHKKLTLGLNDGFQLTATLPRHSVAQISWASSNPAVAAVDENGLVVAMGAGTANVTATTSNGKHATCKVTVQDLSANPTGPAGNLIYLEESETLKVSIYKDHGLFLTYIWARDPGRQLFKYYRNGKLTEAFQEAVVQNNLQDRIVVGFNASPPVNEKFRPDWNRDPVYYHREPSPLMISNGQVLANDPAKTVDGKYLFWVDGNGQLGYTTGKLEDMTVDERRALYQRVIDSGARNTMVWQPLLVADYKPVPLSEEILRKHSFRQKKQALCQIDDHTYLLVSSSNDGTMLFPAFQRYLVGLGVRTAVALDGGSSTTLLYKPRGGEMQRLVGGGRELTFVMCFTEG